MQSLDRGEGLLRSQRTGGITCRLASQIGVPYRLRAGGVDQGWRRRVIKWGVAGSTGHSGQSQDSEGSLWPDLPIFAREARIF